MHYRTLGGTGIKVSPYALGTIMLGSEVGTSDEAEATRLVHKALDAGINLLDTSDRYFGSEECLGKALVGRRENVVLATKVGRALDDDPNHQGSSRRWITTAVENSLRRLRTDYIDLYQIHWPDPSTAFEETLSVLTDLIRSGKVRAVGASNTPAPDIVEAQWVAERRGLERFRSEQSPYSLLSRGIEGQVLPIAQRHGMGVLAWGSLAQGMLTGRVRRGRENDLKRAGMMKALEDERRLDAVEQIAALCEEIEMPMIHLAMAFAITHPGVTSALIGPRTEEQLDGLLAGLEVELSDEILDRVDAIVAPGSEVGTLDQAYSPPSITEPGLRRRAAGARAATSASVSR